MSTENKTEAKSTIDQMKFFIGYKADRGIAELFSSKEGDIQCERYSSCPNRDNGLCYHGMPSKDVSLELSREDWVKLSRPPCNDHREPALYGLTDKRR